MRLYFVVWASEIGQGSSRPLCYHLAVWRRRELGSPKIVAGIPQRMRLPLQLLPVTLLLAALSQTPPSDKYLGQSPGANTPKDIDAWRAAEKLQGLKPYPRVQPGDKNPDGGMRQFGGTGRTSFGSPDLGVPFSDWQARMTAPLQTLERSNPRSDGRALARHGCSPACR